MNERLEHIQYIIDNYSTKLLARLKAEEKDITVDQAMNIFLACDPTPGKKLVDWLVKTYCSKGFRWEDVEAGEESKLAEVLELYQTHFNQIPRDQRNIYLYRSYGALYRLVEPYLVVRSEDTSVGSREIKRQERARALEESEVLYRSEDMIVAVPLTELAAKWWGRGTKWCTSADKNNYFDRYNKDGPLIVILMNNCLSGMNQSIDSSGGNTEKFQLWTDGDEIQFMDSADCEVSLRRIEKDWDRFKPIFDQMIDWNGEFIQFVPDKCLTVEIIKQAVMQTKRAFDWISQDLLTEEICWLAVNQDGEALEKIPDHLKTAKLCRLAIENNYKAMYYVPEKFKTYELCKQAVCKDGALLNHVPQRFRDIELCRLAIEQNGALLKAVPDDLVTLDLCKIAIGQSGSAIFSIPEKFKTPEIYRMAVEKNPLMLIIMPDELKTAEICRQAVERNGIAINYVPTRYQTHKLLKVAVEQNPNAIQNINNNLRSAELCKLAIGKDGLLLRYAPKNLLTHKLCKLAIEQNPRALEYVPLHLKTSTDCKRCVESQGLMICYTPFEFITEELCKTAIEQNPHAFLYIPEKFKTVELINSFSNPVKDDSSSKAQWNREILNELKIGLNQFTSSPSNELSL